MTQNEKDFLTVLKAHEKRITELEDVLLLMLKLFGQCSRLETGSTEELKAHRRRHQNN